MGSFLTSRRAGLSAMLLPLALLSACGPVRSVRSAAGPGPGQVLGGSQPVAGSTIQLYAVSTTADSGPATPLLTSTVTTDANGYFSIYGRFTCPDPAALTFLTATGGKPGLGNGAANPNLALVAAIGRCDTAAVLNPIQIDEVTTVAAVSALAPFMASVSAVGSTPAHAASLQYSFAQAAEMASLSNGSSPGTSVAPGDLVPFVVINSLADTLSACINSPGGTAGDSSPCGRFFHFTGFFPGAGTDTVSALLALNANPTENTLALYNLAPASARFQPTLALPPLSFAIGITHPEPVQLLPLAGIAFANQGVLTTSSPQIIGIYNSGATPAAISSIAVAGANAADFAVSGSCTGTLAPGATCNLRLAFTPGQAGRRTAYLSVQTTGTASYPPAMPLSGSGV